MTNVIRGPSSIRGEYRFLRWTNWPEQTVFLTCQEIEFDGIPVTVYDASKRHGEVPQLAGNLFH